jgi:HK97 family phage prohead protease
VLNVNLNKKGRDSARRRIKAGAYDDASSWSFKAADANALLGDPPDWGRFAQYFLGVDPDAGEETKKRFRYPFVKLEDGKPTVYRSALMAIRSRAAQQGEDDVREAAGRLLELLEEVQDRAAPTGIRRAYYGVAPELREEAADAGISLWPAATRIELRAEGDGELPDLVGYAAVFDELSVDMPWGAERIRPGAFARAIAEKQDVIACLEHQGGLNVLGRTVAGTLELEEDDKGLRVRIKPAKTQTGKDTVVLVKRGDLYQMSFQFRVRKQEVEYLDEEPYTIRELVDVDLYDVAVVAMPAYLGTSVGIDSREDDTGEATDGPAQREAENAGRRRMIETLERRGVLASV